MWYINIYVNSNTYTCTDIVWNCKAAIFFWQNLRISWHAVEIRCGLRWRVLKTCVVVWTMCGQCAHFAQVRFARHVVCRQVLFQTPVVYRVDRLVLSAFAYKNRFEIGCDLRCIVALTAMDLLHFPSDTFCFKPTISLNEQFEQCATHWSNHFPREISKTLVWHYLAMGQKKCPAHSSLLIGII